MVGDRTVTLNPSSGFVDYQWSDGSALPALEVSEEGWYSVTLTDSHGCTTTDSIFVGDAGFEVFAVFNPPACPGAEDGYIAVDSLNGGAAPFQFMLNGSLSGADGIFQALPSGVYTVEVSDAKGCKETMAFFLPEPAPFWVSLGPDQTAILGEAVEITVTASDPLALLEWLPPAPCENCWELYYRPLATETLNVQLHSAAGCMASDAVHIQVLAPDHLVYLPNIFSPNSDGINDEWEACPGPAVLRFLSLQVFSRWGGQMYPVENPGLNAVWNGTVNGKPVPAGVYLCLLEYELITGEKRTEAVQVTVVR